MNAPRGAAARPALVSFDCWNTLLQEKSWPTAHGLRVDALVSASEAAGRPVRRAAAEAAFDAAWQRHMVLWSDGVASGARDVAGWATLGARPAPQAFERLVARYEEASHSSQVRALPGARETLAALGFAGVHRVLICDTGLTPGRVVRRHLAREGLLGHLQVLVFSSLRPRVFASNVRAARRCEPAPRCRPRGAGPRGAASTARRLTPPRAQ